MGFVLYKDSGEVVVLAGPEDFVEAALPEGPAGTFANFLDYARGGDYEPARRLLLSKAARYGPADLSPKLS